MTPPTSSNAIRQAFLDYFRQHEHEVVRSSALVPQNDPSLLFTNAGMVPFKDVFLGNEARDTPRATSAQRCVRAGGKHNDLENVGHTARHHTFFEMLGNFSFGDYFKREAIQYAWTFLTEVMQLPAEKLWVSVYEDDSETEAIWLDEMKVSRARFSRCGADDNFWAMGETGPCGPCTEIFYDHGPSVAGGPPGTPEQDGDRYVEIWNLVFMQYNRDADGNLTALPKPSVDTGMGIERLCAVMQGVHSNYDTDLFADCLQAAALIAGLDSTTHTSLRVIADHIRSTSFLIVDGVSPANEGRGYVLRRIIRRAVRHGYQLGIKTPFLHQLVAPLVQKMGQAYPELANAQTVIEDVILGEEQQFSKTLSTGMKILTQAIRDASGALLAGDVVFKLYDTYGFPVDLTADVLREHGLHCDMQGFEQHMQHQRDLSHAASQFTARAAEDCVFKTQSHFTGYDHTEDQAKITEMVRDNEWVTVLNQGEQGAVVLNNSPFYAESGGQMGDAGFITIDDGSRFQVTDTQKMQQAIVHYGKVMSGQIKLHQTCHAAVNAPRRQAIRLNHSATHLLHAALRNIVGEHVTQKGSLVAPDKLRFDFSHSTPLSEDVLRALEDCVNAKIRENIVSQVTESTPEQAIASGALALFGERYDNTIRVLKMGDFSHEVCGGTHVDATGEIGLFTITSETGVASGIRRIEAVTGEAAVQRAQRQTAQLRVLAEQLKVTPLDVTDKLGQLLQQLKSLEKDNARLHMKLSTSASSDLATHAIEVAGIHVIARTLEGQTPANLRHMVDDLKNKLTPAAIVLATVADSKVTLIAGVTSDCTDKLSAGQLVNFVAQQIDGKGGGRADMAQGGGQNPGALPGALASVCDWVGEQIR